MAEDIREEIALNSENSERLAAIEAVLLDDCMGNVSSKVEVTDERDTLDAFGLAVNMLGEELGATTVNKEYFHNIFNEVDNYIFILNDKGEIQNFNETVYRIFGNRPVEHKSIETYLNPEEKSIPEIVTDLLTKDKIEGKGVMKINGISRNVLYKFNHLNMIYENQKSIVLTLSDVTQMVQKEKEILKAIIDTQEEERNRLAQDLHDDIGQQLAGLKMYLEIINNPNMPEEVKVKAGKTTVDVVDAVADGIRSVCFRLMPRTLKDKGLERSINLLIERLKLSDKIHFQFNFEADAKRFTSDFEINTFRIVQEFVANSIRHGQVTEISINIEISNNNYSIDLTDNGVGFEIKNIEKGMGLLNIAKRVEFINGKLQWKSKLNKGVRLTIKGTL
jgi:PAS domain S-box-containing protein